MVAAFSLKDSFRCAVHTLNSCRINPQLEATVTVATAEAESTTSSLPCFTFAPKYFASQTCSIRYHYSCVTRSYSAATLGG